MKIQSRLILALSALAVGVVLAIVLVFQWRFDRGLLDYVNAQRHARLETAAPAFAEQWRRDGNWDALHGNLPLFVRLLRGSEPEPGRPPEEEARQPPGEETPPPRPYDGHTGEDRPAERFLRAPRSPADSMPVPLRPVALIDADGRAVVGRPPVPGEALIEVPVEVDGRTVGTLAAARVQHLDLAVDRAFRVQQLHTLWVAAVLALVAAVLVAIPLARHFTRPLRQLSQAAHRLTQQHYDIAIPDGRSDELGALARDIRTLAHTLERNAGARQRWFADISHELRTPLAVLSGEIDAMLDGVRPLTRARVESLRQEVAHLLRLVEDLYVLARADLGALQYRRQRFDFAELVRERVEAAQPALVQAGLRVDLQVPAAAIAIDGDEDRLQQLVDNLLTNCRRYTATGGLVRVALTSAPGRAELVVEDSAPGVPDEALPKLFDHLFRVDAARTRSAGGAGLGLAICRRIVEAHEGHVAATHSPLGGLRVTVRLPRATGGEA